MQCRIREKEGMIWMSISGTNTLYFTKQEFNTLLKAVLKYIARKVCSC